MSFQLIKYIYVPFFDSVHVTPSILHVLHCCFSNPMWNSFYYHLIDEE